MHDKNRINHPDRFKQPISWRGLTRHRGIYPTDIDGCIDYAGNAFIFLEAKLLGNDDFFDSNNGQRKAIEAVINALHENGKPSACLLLRHETKSNEIIIAKECIVSDMYFQGHWKPYGRGNVIKCIELWENRFKKMNIYI